MKKIAIVTGASGGLGKEFVNLLVNKELDEVWAIGRNMDKLELLREQYGKKIVPLSLELSKKEAIEDVKQLLLTEKPVVEYLINNAGIGRMGKFEEFSEEEVEEYLAINCKAAINLCICTVPYMKKGSRILNISSQASFQPNPYLNLYSATKAFLTSYSRSLNVELSKKGISVAAVCPGWIDTELLSKEWNGKEVHFPGMVQAAPVARKAMKDADRGRDMSVYGTFVKTMQLFSKIFPHRVVMASWVAGIERYEK